MKASKLRVRIAMSSKSQLVLPPRQLASCIAAGIVRDTSEAELTDAERLNFFPASPLYSATLTLVGQIHVGEDLASPNKLRLQPAADKWLFQAPRLNPHTSWSPGPIFALTLAFYPDAWQRMGGTSDGTPPQRILPALSLLETNQLGGAWPPFWDSLNTVWSDSRTLDHAKDWPAASLIKDWTNHLVAKAAQNWPAASIRSTQRRLAQWTGQNRTSLEFFARIEELHRLRVVEPDATSAELAIEAGYSDQSHMGRMLKRATGFSPAALNRKIATDESFWCYRLLGQRF